jgi:hemerythrin-like metal-binding protein
MSLVWVPELATGNREVDEQHLKLFQLYNDLHAAIGLRAGQEEVGRVLTALAIYVVAHFQMEEAIMARAGYPELATHRASHQIMRIQVENMVDQFKLRGMDPTALLQTLGQWLISHVLNEDKAMARFLAASRQPEQGS